MHSESEPGQPARSPCNHLHRVRAHRPAPFAPEHMRAIRVGLIALPCDFGLTLGNL